MDQSPSWKKLFKYSQDNYDTDLHERGLKVLSSVSAKTYEKCQAICNLDRTDLDNPVHYKNMISCLQKCKDREESALTNQMTETETHNEFERDQNIRSGKPADFFQIKKVQTL